MYGHILSRLEIDVMQVGELLEAAELANKHNLPSLVVHPNLATDAHIARGRVKGQFKLIVPVDWPKGENFGSVKFRGLSTDALEADGFEIMLTPNKSSGDTRNEAKAITEFVHRNLTDRVEVRFVLGSQNREPDQIKELCTGLLYIKTPAMVRSDIGLKVQVSKANPDTHNATLKVINDTVRVPVKLAGNFSGVRAITACKMANFFAVNLVQAKAIIKEFYQQPDQIQDILDGTSSETTTS